jgi:hypothetical protein
MRHGIPAFKPRQPLVPQVNAGVLNQIRRELESLRITRVIGGTFRKLPGGTEIQVNTARGGGGPRPVHPFQLSLTRTQSAPTVDKIRIRYGTINAVAPSGMSLGDDPPYLLTPSTTSGLIYAVVTFDRELAATPITSRSLGVAEDELPEDTIDTAHIEIGSWATVDDRLELAQSVSGSLWVDPYGFTYLWGLV